MGLIQLKAKTTTEGEGSLIINPQVFGPGAILIFEYFSDTASSLGNCTVVVVEPSII